MNEYTYILAPNTAHNYAILQLALQEFADIVPNKQLKTAYKKSTSDVVDSDGLLVVPAFSQTYIYLKAKTAEISEALLSQVQDCQLFTIDTQPFAEYWI